METKFHEILTKTVEVMAIPKFKENHPNMRFCWKSEKSRFFLDSEWFGLTLITWFYLSYTLGMQDTIKSFLEPFLNQYRAIDAVSKGEISLPSHLVLCDYMGIVLKYYYSNAMIVYQSSVNMLCNLNIIDFIAEKIRNCWLVRLKSLKSP